MADETWIDEIFPEAAGSTARLDATTIDRLAEILHLDRVDVAIGLRGTLRIHGYEVPPFEVRTNTWRIDLPGAVAHTVLAGLAGAAIIAAAGAPPLPTALVSLAAPLLLRIRRVELEARDITLHAELTAAARDEPQSLQELYQRLPARSRAELSIGELTEVVERLLDARLAAVGPDGVRLRAGDGRHGFRLALTAPSLVPSLLHVTALPPTGAPDGSSDPAAVIAPAGPGTGLRLADGRPRVFISYAQESENHKRDVLAFAECLHASGVGVILDQDTLAHRGDWQLWATKHITESDYVLVIASPTCRKVGDGTIDPDRNKGLQAEMRTLRELYNSDHPTWLRRVLPVILPGMTVDDIPLFLQPHNADHYKVVSLDQVGAVDVLRTLTSP
ncbi:SEFIR domain-containing protein [Plantactinospora solaniradicis]|uniref:SEFIR domain-containing protein n=1 Tax=Plantactinospora solaniradicis TaxID=1723736 RepID=A0ABW1KPM8_9ACTN